jgi:hypothetical protein
VSQIKIKFAQHDGLAHCFACRKEEKKVHNVNLNLAQLRFFEGRFNAEGRFGNLKKAEGKTLCKSCIRALRKVGLGPAELEEGWTFVEEAS